MCFDEWYKPMLECLTYVPVDGAYNSRLYWRRFEVSISKFKRRFAAHVFARRLDLLERLRRLVSQATSYLGQHCYLDFLSALIPEYVCTHTMAGNKLCDELNREINTTTSVTDKFGLNYLDVLHHLQRPNKFLGMPTYTKEWVGLSKEQRIGLSCVALLATQLAEPSERGSVIAQALGAVQHGRMWYLTGKDDSGILAHLATLTSAVRAGWCRGPELNNCVSSWAPAWAYVFAENPVLQCWLRLDPTGILSFLRSGCTVVDPRIKLKGSTIVRQTRGGVPIWTVRITGAQSHADFRSVASIFPYPSDTDKRHMNTNVAAYLQTYCGMKWVSNYHCAFSAAAMPTRTSILRRINLLLSMLPLGTYQPLVLSWLTVLGADVDLTDPVFEYFQTSRLLHQSMPVLRSTLKNTSICLRRCAAVPTGQPVSDEIVTRYAYLELAVGRANMVSEWAEEVENRTKQTYHIVTDIDFAGRLKWRPDSVAHARRDPEFYRRFRIEAKKIFARLIPVRVPSETFEAFLERRSEWMTSGSSAGEYVVVDGEKLKVNKRGWAETIESGEYSKLLYTSVPIEEAVASEKYENGKGRAIYGTKTLHYIISSYATRGFEEALHNIEGFEKGLPGVRQWGAEVKRARLSGNDRQHLTMLDYSDFNIQHTPEVQAILYEVCAEIGVERSAPRDWVKAHQWLAASKYNVVATFPDNSQPSGVIQLRVVQGMFSGTRSTDLINTVCNLIYFRIASDLVKENYGLCPEELYHVHQGDDVWVSNTNAAWAAALYYVMNQMGFVFNKYKQMFGNGRGEFLRVLSSNGVACGYSVRALTNLFTRQLQNRVGFLPEENVPAITDSLTTLSRRGLSRVSLFVLHQDLLDYWGKVRAFPGDPIPLKLPPLVLWSPPVRHGLDCAPPFLSLEPQYSPLPRHLVTFDARSLLAKLPGRMTKDWITYVSNKVGGQVAILANTLTDVSKSSNYADVIRLKTSFLPYKQVKNAWRKTLSKSTELKQPPPLISLGVDDWYTPMGWNDVPKSNSSISPANRIRLPPVHLAHIIMSLVHNPDLPSDAGRNLVQGLLACSSCSPFKSIAMTKTALGVSEIEALQFILHYVSTSDTAPEEARQFISDMIAAGEAFPLHMALTAAFGYIGVLRYCIHPNLVLSINTQVKSQLLKYVRSYPEHTSTDWMIMWNQRALELLRHIQTTSLAGLPSVLF